MSTKSASSRARARRGVRVAGGLLLTATLSTMFAASLTTSASAATRLPSAAALHVHVLPAAAFNQKVSYFRSKAGPALANAPRGYTYTKQYTAKLRAAAATHSIAIKKDRASAASMDVRPPRSIPSRTRMR